jgi:homoaconitate hydratase
MGSREAFVYLSSPAVVAASAIAGRIASPDRVAGDSPRTAALPLGRPEPNYMEQLRRGASCRTNKRPTAGAAAVTMVDGFPKQMEGELLFVPADNLNTDGIYGKDYTYKEGMTPQQMAAVAMENYDPQFQRIAREGDILVGGYNFGSGSSREQAATALKYRGLQMVIAGSYSQTYKRNAFNNGYIVIECPELVDDLKASMKNEHQPTIRTDRRAVVDFTESKINVAGPDERRQYEFSPLGEVAQALIVMGGFEAVIRAQMASPTA